MAFQEREEWTAIANLALCEAMLRADPAKSVRGYAGGRCYWALQQARRTARRRRLVLCGPEAIALIVDQRWRYRDDA
jgi:hypothetical protein